MRTEFGRQLVELTDDAAHVSAPPVADLLRRGRRLRLFSAGRWLLTVAVVTACFAFVAWPHARVTAVPAQPDQTKVQAQRTYPSVIPAGHFVQSALTADRPMSAVYVAHEQLYAVDDRGQTWRVPRHTAGDRTAAALSPDGRYATDGFEVYDFVTGSSRILTQFGPNVRGDIRAGTGWSPDSSYYVAIDQHPGNVTVAVGTATGGAVQAPITPFTDPESARVAWLDNRRVLLVVAANALPTADDETHGAVLLAFTWTLGDGVWEPAGSLRLPAGAQLDHGTGYGIAVSPDAHTIALSVDYQSGPHDGLQALSWPLPTGSAMMTQSSPVGGAGIFLDGLTWRGNELVTSTGNRTVLARTGQVLSEVGDGPGRPIFWRAGAFDEPAYYDTLAVWQDRLFVWTIIMGSLTLIGLLVRLTRPLSVRAGMVSARYIRPIPWMLSR